MAGESQKKRLVNKKGKSNSTVWNHFGFDEKDEDQKHITCKNCFVVVSAPTGNTTNLFNHLKFNHRELHDNLMKKQNTKKTTPSTTSYAVQSSISESLYAATPYPSTSERHQKITESIVHYLAKGMCSANTSDNSGFRQMVNTLDKRYVLPSRHHFTRAALPALYEKRRHEVANELLGADFFAIMTDLWSSRTMEPYISLTVHFIDSDFNLNAKCLQASFLPEDHTGENIANGLKDAMAAWSLNEEKLVCLTTDNAANVILIVASFSYSWKKKRDLAQAQKQLNLPEHSLKTECPTRWGSRQAMIERILEQQTAITQVLSADKKLRHLIPTWQDIDVLEAVNKALSPLVEFTDALSGETYISVSFIKPTLHLFNHTILGPEEGENEMSKSIKRKILKYLNDKYSCPAVQELLDMASALDPRFKLKYVSQDNREAIEKRLININNFNYNTKSGDADCVAEAAAPKKKKRGLGSFFKACTDGADGPVAVQQEQVITLELGSYLQSNPLDPDEDPLKRWGEFNKFYPRLSKVARKYLCIPATSSSSERVFSTSGNIVSCLRASLKPDHVNRLVFLPSSCNRSSFKLLFMSQRRPNFCNLYFVKSDSSYRNSLKF
uniref:BED-type domain-containing protein n=1 Tax=Sphaeramia orbicularis TaxID=375764 RepID=A0A673CIH1_9TELE